LARLVAARYSSGIALHDASRYGGETMTIELTSQQAEELYSILDNYLSDLRMEIVDTESHEFREMLKARKDFLQQLLAQLKAASKAI
jgi:LPS O-antigen subunit length determinant protein (WzzB/FepE family)